MRRRRAQQRYVGAGTGWFIAGYVGVSGFFALEATTRERGRAASLDASVDDQDTTRLIVSAYAVAATLSPVLRWAAVSRLPYAAGPAGVALQAGGLAIRAWSMHTLRGRYSRTLRSENEQEVIDTGPYRLVRHPGYAGSLLTWTGFALTSRSLPVVGLVAGLLGHAYQRRITAEETLLRRDLPSYTAYCRRTKKIIPFVWLQKTKPQPGNVRVKVRPAECASRGASHGVSTIATTSTSRSAPGMNRRDTSTVVLVGGIPANRGVRTAPYSPILAMSVR
jgi:protein-S-isoprenylcysteine O-methyltransferase Ste14